MLARAVSAAVVLGVVVGGSAVLAGNASAGGFERGGSICGTVWHDLNEDGYREPGEPAIANHVVSINGQHKHARSGQDGRYCLTGLPVGEYVLKSGERAKLDQTGWSPDRPGGSRFSRTTGLGYDTDGMNNLPIKITNKNGKYTHAEGFDSGFVTARNDQKAMSISDPRGPVYKVGDVIEIYGLVDNAGNVADYVGGTLTLPEGLTILYANGRVDGQQVIVDLPERSDPGFGPLVGGGVRFDKVMTDAEIKIEVHKGVFADIDPSNNVLTKKITVVE